MLMNPFVAAGVHTTILRMLRNKRIILFVIRPVQEIWPRIVEESLRCKYMRAVERAAS